MITAELISDIKKKVEAKNKNFREQVLFSTRNISKVINEYDEELLRVDGEIPVDLPIKNNDRFLFISYEQTRYTHGIHKYPAKFFPELPRWLIKRFSKMGEIVLDPFGGSATTSVEALLHNRNSVSIDVDPFARFIAKVKTTKLEEEELKIYSNLLIKKITEYSIANLRKYIPKFPYRDNWFKKEIILELAYIKKCISELNISDELRNFFFATFSSIIRNVSNADNNCTRTVVRKKLNKNIYPSLALTKFVENLLLYSSRMKEFNDIVNGDYFVEIPEDSEAKKINYPNNYFDLSVTSPPYANAVDYPRTHQLEMYWLGLANGSLTPLKKKHVGTESVSVNSYRHFHKTGINSADLVLEKIFSADKRRSFIAYKFLMDMEKNLQEVYRTLKPNGKYAMVIGNNTIRQQNFESWKYLMEIGERNNFKVIEYFGSEIIRHFIKIKRSERINTDWIIVFEKK